MRDRHFIIIGIVTICSSLTSIFIPTPVAAWDVHQTLMPWILEGAKPDLQSYLSRTVTMPCSTKNTEISSHLKAELKLNPTASFPFNLQGESENSNCDKLVTTSISQLLLSGFVDDPDRGMDQNLPEELGKIADPNEDRIWMGGLKGPTSQGFRHMFFSGFSFSHIQIPTRAIGQAPQRVQTLFDQARKYIRTGQIAWGVRLIAWSLHYLQDLAQPFHAVQIPSKSMVPWLDFLHGMDELRHETTRTITNYHWAYEGYTLNRMNTGPNSPFRECILTPEKFISPTVNFNTLTAEGLALWVAQQSESVASDLGAAEIGFLTDKMTEKGVDYTQNLDLYDFTQMSTNPQLTAARDRLNAVTCKALAHASLASRLVILWALRPTE